MSGVRCPACGLVNFAGNDTCRRCGGLLSASVGISTGGLPGRAAYPGNPLPTYPTQQTQEPGAGVFGAPQQPPSTFSHSQPSGSFGGVAPQGGFIPPPPGDAAAYARAPYAAVPYQTTYPGPAARPASLRQGMAITSLVLGCLSPFSCAVFGVGAIVGIVLGIVATVKAQRYPAEYGGKVMAIIGIALNGFSIVVVLPIALAIAIPNLMLSRMAANEASAIATLRSIGTAEATYQSTVTSGRGFGNLDQLIEAGFLPRGAESKSGYRFEIRAMEDRSRFGSQYRFEAFATPVAYRSTGRRSYYVNQDFVIRGADKSGRQASSVDPPIDSPSSSHPTRSSY